MTNEEAKKLAEAHWNLLAKWQRLVFIDGFIHGVKHETQHEQKTSRVDTDD